MLCAHTLQKHVVTFNAATRTLARGRVEFNARVRAHVCCLLATLTSCDPIFLILTADMVAFIALDGGCM